jgi:hypothetical protein
MAPTPQRWLCTIANPPGACTFRCRLEDAAKKMKKKSRRDSRDSKKKVPSSTYAICRHSNTSKIHPWLMQTVVGAWNMA